MKSRLDALLPPFLDQKSGVISSRVAFRNLGLSFHRTKLFKCAVIFSVRVLLSRSLNRSFLQNKSIGHELHLQ